MPKMQRPDITFAAAIREGLDQAMEKDRRVIVIGEGVPDPKAIFDTTAGLRDKYGDRRVFDMPLAENGMTGICIGAALSGMRPIMVHQRVDFALLAMDQLINNAAKWHYMFDGKASVPLVVRMIVGRGWGQGPQHSQSLQAMFAQAPGIRVIMPTTAYDAKGMLISAIEDNNPVLFIEPCLSGCLPDPLDVAGQRHFHGQPVSHVARVVAAIWAVRPCHGWFSRHTTGSGSGRQPDKHALNIAGCTRSRTASPRNITGCRWIGRKCCMRAIPLRSRPFLTWRSRR